VSRKSLKIAFHSSSRQYFSDFIESYCWNDQYKFSIIISVLVLSVLFYLASFLFRSQSFFFDLLRLLKRLITFFRNNYAAFIKYFFDSFETILHVLCLRFEGLTAYYELIIFIYLIIVFELQVVKNMRVYKSTHVQIESNLGFRVCCIDTLPARTWRTHIICFVLPLLQFNLLIWLPFWCGKADQESNAAIHIVTNNTNSIFNKVKKKNS